MSHPVYSEAPLAAPESPYVFDLSKSNLNIIQAIDSYLPFPEKVSNYSVPVENTSAPNYSPIYRNQAFPKAIKSAVSPDFDTYHKVFNESVKHRADKPCFSTREFNHDTQTLDENYTTISYKEVNEMKKHYGSGILYLLQNNPYKESSKFESHSKIDRHLVDFDTYNKDNFSFVFSIYSGNRKEWVLSDLMCSSFSITSTALYDTLGPESSVYILESTQSPIVATTKNHIQQIIELKIKNPESLGSLISIVSFDPLNLSDNAADQSLVHLCRKHNITLFDINQVIQVGKMFPTLEIPPTPETIYTVSFTSGTTGSKAKGVILTQKNVTAAVCFILFHCPHFDDGKVFAFLPLAHIFERETVAFALAYGAQIGFPRQDGTPLTLVEDLKYFKPHHMSNVPRIFTKFETLIKSATSESTSLVKQKVFDYAFATKSALHSQYDGARGSHGIIDNLLLPAIRKVLGFDHMRFVISGSAPISPSTIKFLKSALNVGVIQGYGLTETFAGFTVSSAYEKNPGSCGPIGITSEMKLKAIPEMNYTENDADGPRGELLVRGSQLFTAYFKNPEETKAAVDEEGWFHTGDIARIDKDTGRLYIIDRVKSFFKLSQGEYVTPEKVETSYLSANPILTQCFAHGNSNHHFLVGILGIDPNNATKLLISYGAIDKKESTTISNEKILELINKPDIRTKILSKLNANVKNIQGFEKIQNIFIEFEPLTLERDLITPTIKIRRPIAAKFFKQQIDSMYEEGPLAKNKL